MKTNRALIITVFTALVAGPWCLRSIANDKIDPDADRIFKAACKYFADARSFSFKVEVWKDLALQSGVKLQTSRTLEVQQRRPDQLDIEVRSPRASQGFWYQNKSLTMLDRKMNLYGVTEAPENIDKAIDTVEERFGVEIPLGDVLVADPYRNMRDNMETATHVGKVTVLGVVCDHLVFTGPSADCQVWIAEGARPLPRKIVSSFKAASEAAQVVVSRTSSYYDPGVYYVQNSSGYVVVTAPVGAVVAPLPAGTLTVMAGPATHYYCFNGTFYVQQGTTFVIVAPPIGVSVTMLPAGATQMVISDMVYYQHGGVYYRPVIQNGVTVYTIVEL